MGFWHTGYAEFHEYEGLPAFVYSPPPSVRYICEQCRVSYADVEELRRHRFELHPGRQPTLLLRGRPVGSLPQRVMTRLSASEVQIEDADSCLLNGRSIEVGTLGAQLASMRREFIELHFENAGVTAKCVLDFRIADEEHLSGIESAFMRLARGRTLNIDAIEMFINNCTQFQTALPYCQGICNYLYGVLAKERSPESGLNHDQYIERYMRSTEELAAWDRPLARGVRALIAFHFNHFEDAKVLTAGGRLRHVAKAYSRIQKGEPWRLDRANPCAHSDSAEHLLMDRDTQKILTLSNRMGEVDPKDLLPELLAHCQVSLGAYDQLKFQLLAVEALAVCNNKSSRAQGRQLVRRIASQHDLGEWAKSMRIRLGKS